MKDSRNILLLVVSLCLVGTWVYHLYDKNNYSNQPPPVSVNDSMEVQRSTNDSLRLAYNTVLSQIDSSRTADTATIATIPTATNEIDSLRNEIAAILTINNITKEDLRRAEEKIKQLQQRLSTTTANTSTVDNTKPAATSATGNNKTGAPAKQEAVNEVFAASGISVRALQSEGKDQITMNAASASSLAIACILQNKTTSFTDTEVYMVLTDPSGEVVQDDPWQSGMFTTGTDRIPYTRKAKLAYTKGDNSRIAMNLNLPEYAKGLYSVQFYHNGVRIGRSTLRLN